MSTVAALEQPAVEVLPGAEAVCGLRIRNDGPIVESYAIEVLGDVAEFASAEPSTLSVFPGTDGYALVRFTPPRTSRVPAGDLPYAVRVMPVERPDDQVVPEGLVRILPFTETGAELTPRTSKGWRGARHEVAIDNRGNVPLQVGVGGSDPDNRLAIATRPAALTVAPGQAAFVTVAVRPRRLLWRGQPVTYPFQVLLAPEADPPVTLDGATVQTPLVPRGAGRVLAALLILLLLGAGLWWGVLRPAVRSAAREATAEQIAPVQQKAVEASAAAEKAVQAASGGGGAATQPTGGAPAPTPTAVPPGTVPDGTTPVTRRLTTSSGGGGTDTSRYTVPAGRTITLTDIFFQNPQGDDGRLDLLVDGQTLFTQSLANFRDLDYHLVSPIEMKAGAVVSLRVTCGAPGRTLAGATGGTRCREFALLGGFQRRTPTPNP
ncbi:COG1470 family protein [Rhizomonospora bruguierae]|uniref:COG1470 family protein n=1 Tax=Rhizomonospora bruguierae TaxID=1581705 RepID=UPI001BD0D2C3|nr:hypothetical protein [Micromonospora sp. NBRC 107566]